MLNKQLCLDLYQKKLFQIPNLAIFQLDIKIINS